MNSYQLYEGKLQLDFDEAKHVYTVEGQKVESMTGILKVVNKPMLIGWAAKMAGDYIVENLKPGQSLDEVQLKDLVAGAKMAHRRKNEAAADIGTMGHAWIESYLKGEKPAEPINPLLKNITTTFKQFMHDHKVQILDTERKVYSVEHRVAGTLDSLALYEGRRAIIDWKSGSGIYPEAFLQCGGYDICLSEEEEFVALGKGQKYDPIELHIIVNCSKTGELAVAISDKVDRHKLGFLAALQLQRVMKELEAEAKERLK